MKIYKYPLTDENFQVIETPAGSRILEAQVQRGVITLWVIILDTETKLTEPHSINLIATGEEFDFSGKMRYIATVQMPDGEVWHVFEEEAV